MIQQAPAPESSVLSTLHEDGSRRWLHPRVSSGRFWNARRITAYGLIAVFTLLPYLRIGGKPSILLDIPHREFTFFGFTFLPTDTLLLALFLLAIVLSIFLVTALFGRVWCGWMCPQTVYTEFLFRPIERLLDGRPGPRQQPGKKKSPLRTVIKYGLYLLISVYLAHTFLAYFVGVENLAKWIRQSPLEHPMPFLVMLFVTGTMMFDFSYFREQTCIVACPYGRFQSVMLDRDSLIISYDPQRGEPRAKPSQRKDATQPQGDCIDCGLCVDTCPTGIDIRDGLQMECVACTQCIDACDNVMDKLSKPRGLIRFSSEARIGGERGRLIRPRVIIYPTLMVALVTTFAVLLAGKQSADVTLLRGLGVPYQELNPGQVTNHIRVKIANRSDQPASYGIEVVGDDEILVTADQNPWEVQPGESRTQAVTITAPAAKFIDGKRDISLRVSDGADFSEELNYRLLGPYNTTTP